ncbi:unnamed protein product [Dicrocoelium dendriticum]|nr:unnamed protein product [Dicrocoelium dendriticum]
METEMLFCSDIPLPMEPGFCLPVPRSSWVHLDEPPHSNRSSVAVRLRARVLEVYPNSVDDLQNCTVLACQRCRTATRLSSILDGNEDPCECNTSPLHANGTEHPSKRVLCPFVLLKLEDPTGQLVVCAPATSGVALLTRSTDQATQNAQWDQVANELFGSHATDERAVAKNLLRQLSNLLTRSVELVLRVSWLSSWELGEPILIGQLDLKFELLNEQPLTWSTCND